MSGAKTKCWTVVEKVDGSNPEAVMSFLELVELRMRTHCLYLVEEEEGDEESMPATDTIARGRG